MLRLQNREERDHSQFCDATEESWNCSMLGKVLNVPNLCHIPRQHHHERTARGDEMDDRSSDLTDSFITTSVRRILTAFEIDSSQVRANLVTKARITCFKTLLVFLLLVIVAVTYNYRSPENERHKGRADGSDAPTSAPNKDHRIETMKKCASQLSGKGILLDTDDSPQKRAIDWFIDGAGLLIPAPTDCQWDSEFAMLYALLVIREALSVQDSSWHTRQPLHFAAEVCSWARIHCANGIITKLSFNNAALDGTLPSESSGLIHLTQLDMFTNHGLAGTVPTEMGGLSSLGSLKIHETNISGTVPTEIGSMKALREFLLHGTLLTGKMPSEVCTLHLDALVANCNLITCPCCTKCKSELVGGSP